MCFLNQLYFVWINYSDLSIKKAYAMQIQKNQYRCDSPLLSEKELENVQEICFPIKNKRKSVCAAQSPNNVNASRNLSSVHRC